MRDTVSRRSVVGALGVGVLLAAFAEVELTAGKQEEMAGLLPAKANGTHPFRAGSKIARWTIKSVRPIQDGALSVLVTDNTGHEFTLDVLARDLNPLAPRAPAETEGLAIYVRNGGNGWLPTAEEQGLAAMTLAHFLSTNGRGSHIPGLLSMSERLATLPQLTADGSKGPAPVTEESVEALSFEHNPSNATLVV